MLVSLRTLIDEAKEDCDVRALLSSFSCPRDGDIEYFLHERAVEFELLSKSRTYLILDEEELLTKTITEIHVLGYIALALKILTVPDELSNRARQDIDGLSAKIHGEQIKDFPCYLIGQLARNSLVSSEVLPGSALIAYAQDVIAVAQEAVGGRYMMVECRDSKKLLDFYRANEFQEIARVPDRDLPMVQLIRKIQ